MEDKYSGILTNFCKFFFWGRRVWGGLKAESVSGGVEDPWIVVGALHARVQSQRLSGQLPGGEGAGIWQGTERLTLNK